ncbi:cytidine deaminase [Novosphingobium aromaticivorans DSM 12444]|uniref:Cytidine deaminase n=1 Tax=Novosphingobium aromaticivorans (strain ATCC 700278 / DSM 12444 / CCUG 56034 / CIP 105152 / NBRC 16084 / F199) TaxID=279238 RepID=Q2GC29_NOVAD|nr:cytidine deaminase [Novosphingobium aromaticivorans]ABD24594.1 cytidine deaminase [Novosphingobium aromaticivorans DSM 12444]SCY23438.1 cytidine deaminase [Novosphingobium aromaticivorans]
MSIDLVAERREALVAAARTAMGTAYAPYSGFHVGAALLFEDGAIVTGANVENASYGLSLCAETVACSIAAHAGRRGGLLAVAVSGGAGGRADAAISPCGRCRQVLNELAALGGTDPLVICTSAKETVEMRLSALLPNAFGPANLA